MFLHETVSARQPAGVYHLEWDGRNQEGEAVTSGVYLYRLSAGSYEEVRKMLLLRSAKYFLQPTAGRAPTNQADGMTNKGIAQELFLSP